MSEVGASLSPGASGSPSEGTTPPKASPRDDIIVLSKVSRTYPPRGGADKVRALRKVSLTIPRGARVAIRGESGSGKSTLLALLGGLDVPTKGTITVDGDDLSKLGEAGLARYRAQKVGFVFQTFNLLPELTALENVELPMEVGKIPREQRHARALELLDAVGIRKRVHHRPTRLSGGEQQRVAIARALANEPALILADEPTGNLDRKSRRKTMELLEKVHQQFGTTLVIVTHDPNVANTCEKVFVIRYGSIVRQYEPDGGRHPDVPDEADEAEEGPDDEDEGGKDDE